ncbi:MAG: twin-arginine translocase TatA/TatE family subunit [bacterium]|nr:twin-arginine translocase TatA/TatE family subunit [bacterium]
MFGLGTPEIVLLVVVFGLLFGGKNLLGFAKTAGRLGGEFKKGQMEIEEELKNLKNSGPSKK